MNPIRQMFETIKRSSYGFFNTSEAGRGSCDLKRIEAKIDSMSQKINISEIDRKLDNQFNQIESLLALYHTLPNLKRLPATRGWAGSPDFLLKISEIILKEKPAFVLEAGSGVSTVIIGLALKLDIPEYVDPLKAGMFWIVTVA